MTTDFRLGGQTNAKLKLSWQLEKDDWETLQNGREVNKNGFVTFAQPESDTKMWPVILDREPSRITVGVPIGGKMIQVKIGKKVGRDFVFNSGGRDHWFDSTFTCPWVELSQNRYGEIYEKETVLISGGWATTNRGDDIRAKISLRECKPDKTWNEKVATCDLKVVTGSDLNNLFLFKVCVFIF